MTPSPDGNEAFGSSNKQTMNMNSVERTTEKYSGFYSRGKNVRSKNDVNKNIVDNESENDNDTDDEFEMGILNLSNHDINDDDEVLQGVSYLTPPSKSLTHVKNFSNNSIKNNTKNSTKIPNKVFSPKGTIISEIKSPDVLYTKHNYLSIKTVKTPIKRFLIEKRGGNEKKDKLNDNSSTCAFMESVKSDEMTEMTAQIKALICELKYFEELTGKRCIFETKVRSTHAHTHAHAHRQ